MKKYVAIIILIFFASFSFSQYWKVQSENGEFMIKAFTESGENHDVVAFSDAGYDCFMDVKAQRGMELIAVKMILSDLIYIPVVALADNGEQMPIKAINEAGEILEVSGISRFGNTVRIAIMKVDGSFEDVYAVSDDGRKRIIAGVKFKEENIEMEIDYVPVVAHVKGLPEVDIETEETVWDIKAMGPAGNLDIIVLDRKGEERSVNALSAGGSFTMLNVKADVGRDLIAVKLRKGDKGIYMSALDHFGREYAVKAKAPDGSYLDITGGEVCGKTIDIKVIDADGNDYAVMAISPAGDLYDVRGIKIFDKDREGMIQGINGFEFFYAHVKALPPVE